MLLRKRLLWQCGGCRYQVSLTAGTVLHGTRTPLHLWFWATYLMATGTPGISAVQLQRQLGISRYETAWMMLQKLRRAMVNPERQLLTEEVEVDECFVGGLDRELRGGRQHGTKALVAVAVEVRGAASGRVRMQVVPDASTATLCGFVADVVAEGGVVHTDGWNAYRRLSTLGYDHRPRTQKPGRVAVDDLDEILPRVHRVISNLKTWLLGTHSGVSKEHLQVYLDEYVFRFNRRHPDGGVPDPAGTRWTAVADDVPADLRGRPGQPRQARPLNVLTHKGWRSEAEKRVVCFIAAPGKAVARR